VPYEATTVARHCASFQVHFLSLDDEIVVFCPYSMLLASGPTYLTAVQRWLSYASLFYNIPFSLGMELRKCKIWRGDVLRRYASGDAATKVVEDPIFIFEMPCGSSVVLDVKANRFTTAPSM
jgi:hypothetical protein